VARILVAGDAGGLARRTLLTRLVGRLQSDGHDAALHRDAEEGPADSVREADALVAVLDGSDAATAAAVAFASALHKPVLGLAARQSPVPAFLRELCTRVVEADEVGTWLEALPAFYEDVRPFAGRLVRDLVPQLVKEAGHEVAFRSLSDAERPRFLKQKIAEEARELAKADLGREKEEIETLIKTRAYGRDDLRAIKDAKRKRRGGFEKCFVVESTARDGAPAPESKDSAAPAESGPSSPAPGPPLASPAPPASPSPAAPSSAAPPAAAADRPKPAAAKASKPARAEAAPDADELEAVTERPVEPSVREL
jgi:predicted house-cleaning noncanonical NTP pyrophosphatase (MazG superfamily)